jgi:hypothetical protein
LLPEIEIGEFPTVEVPLNTGTAPEVPLPVTVCANALAELTTSANPSTLIHPCIGSPFQFSTSDMQANTNTARARFYARRADQITSESCSSWSLSFFFGSDFASK